MHWKPAGVCSPNCLTNFPRNETHHLFSGGLSKFMSCIIVKASGHTVKSGPGLLFLPTNVINSVVYNRSIVEVLLLVSKQTSLDAAI